MELRHQINRDLDRPLPLGPRRRRLRAGSGAGVAAPGSVSAGSARRMLETRA